MFHKDISYLYSNEWQSSSTTNEKPSSGKISSYSSMRSTATRVHAKMNSLPSIHHRSKHILITREDLLQGNNDRREKSRLATRRLKERRQLFEENLLKTLKFYDEEQLELEEDLKQREIYKQNLQHKILQNIYGSSPTENDQMSSSMDHQTFPYLTNNPWSPVK